MVAHRNLNLKWSLRMAANYAWPRGAKWLMERRVLAGRSTK